MPKKVKPVPTGYRTVTPYLVVRGADAALSYYEAALGATIVSRHTDETGTSVIHAEMKIGNAIVLVCDEAPEIGVLSPSSLGATPVAMHLYLTDLDVAWERAVNSGARVLVPLHDTLVGERFGKIVDPFGHVWTLAMRIALPSNENRPQKIEDAIATRTEASVAEDTTAVVADVVDAPAADVPADEVPAGEVSAA
ncbi:MAG: VOC family protein [Rhodospirillales bacterium]